jgi:hypothetical protein
MNVLWLSVVWSLNVDAWCPYARSPGPRRPAPTRPRDYNNPFLPQETSVADAATAQQHAAALLEAADDCCVLLAVVRTQPARSPVRVNALPPLLCSHVSATATCCALSPFFCCRAIPEKRSRPQAGTPNGSCNPRAPHTPRSPSPLSISILKPPTQPNPSSQIDDVQYNPTLEALSEVFSVYGPLAKVQLLYRGGAWQALVQYRESAAAASAKQYLNGHAMYPGGVNKVGASWGVMAGPAGLQRGPRLGKVREGQGHCGSSRTRASQQHQGCMCLSQG